ncbi:MAG: hypothetical protein GF349_00895 [Candidatus Magasanikbacteria bacterium]|nr:hypothetical protein [Candidatus Magasanikbacteria bacterium]
MGSLKKAFARPKIIIAALIAGTLAAVIADLIKMETGSILSGFMVFMLLIIPFTVLSVLIVNIFFVKKNE